MANKKISELESRASLSLSDLMAVGDPSTGYLYKTTISDLKTLTGAGVVSFNGRFGSVNPAEGDYTLTQLADVIITSPSSNQILQYNGSNWVNAASSFITLASLSATSPLAYNSSTGAFSIQAASGSQNGYLSSTDWNTFNNKQNALTNPVTGTGTTNYLAKFTGSSTIGNTQLVDNGSVVYIGTSSSYRFTIQASANDVVSSSIYLNNTNNGTASASYLTLGASGASAWLGVYATAYSNASWAGRLVIGMSSAGNGVTISASGGSTQDIVFAVQAGTVMRMLPNQNVLIGSVTDSTLAKFQVTGAIQQTSVTSSLLKTNASGVLVAAIAGTDYAVPSALSSYVTLDTAQTITGNKIFSTAIAAAGGISLRDTVGGSNYGGIVANSSYFQISAQGGSAILIKASDGTNALTIGTTGNTAMTNVTAISFIKSGGTSSQFLKADGSVDSSTYATTSSLSSYLPLVGGTLTGALVGTSAQFTSGITASGGVFNGFAINANPVSAGTGASFTRYLSTGADFYIGTENSAGSFFGASAYANVFYMGSTNLEMFWGGAKKVTITSAGAATFSSSVTATHGLFSLGTYTSNGLALINSNSSDGPLIVGNTDVNNNSVVNVGAARLLFGGGGYAVQTSPVTGVGTARTWTNQLTIALTGAATFSSSVTAGGKITSASGAYRAGGFYIPYSAASGSSRTWAMTTDENAFGDFSIIQSTTQTGDVNQYRLYINPSGNIGVGTLDVDAKFKIYSDSPTNLMLATVSKSSVNIVAQKQGIGYTDLDIDANAIKLFTNGSERMRISSGGNVGINTSSPDQKLTINQGATGTGQGIPATSGSTQNGILRLRPAVGIYGETFDFGMNVASTYAWMQATNAGGLGTNYNIAINPNGGNVGIGTSSPSSKLHVNGQILTDRNGIKIPNYSATGAWEIGSDPAVGAGIYFYLNTAGYQLTLSSAGVLYTAGGGTSDIRTKKNIEYIDSGINAILSLKPAKFEFKIDEGKTRRGFIAQDVLSIIPDLVLGNGDKEGGIYGLDYDGILALAVKAIQEQQAQIDSLKKQLA